MIYQIPFINDILMSLYLLIFIFILITIFSLILISIWVYRDTKKRNMNSFSWILIIWVIPFFIGVIIYLKVRIQSPTLRR